ncbi:diaminopimelate decarboxylase [Salibacteraceae bacterium]|nr:diaminopimelate decarboxylase [Salibacteraceae bacterium]MDB9710015.1 diaminopimelate decarboxylase [Salibacteraceae bacterium]
MISAQHIREFEERATPFYFYDLKTLSDIVDRAKASSDRFGYHLHYALKANSNDPILKLMKEKGLGADCVSGGEVSKALEIGFNSNDIAFAGVGKTDKEINLAIENNIFSINVESIEELRVIEHFAALKNKKVRIALRLNPDVDAQTHHYITTGLEENKFGISGWQINEVLEFMQSSSFLLLEGLHFHIGSQIKSLEPFRNLCGRINNIQELFEEKGFRIKHINAGGGLGIDYQSPDSSTDPDFERFFSVFNDLLELRPGQELHFELGRSLVANCGDLISRVLYVKQGLKTNFLILDAGMTELIRPALYQSVHSIENLSERSSKSEAVYDVVGPVCESSDCFGKAFRLKESKRGDLIAIRSAGAYGETMSSHYNLTKLEESLYID